MGPPARAIARRTLGDARNRTVAFALFAFVYALGQVAAYSHSYADLQDRLDFARSFGDNKAIRVFYGTPHDLLTDGGYAAWRVGGVAVLFFAMWGVLSSVVALRGDEESGRAELVLAGAIGRGGRFRAVCAGLLAGAAILWLGLFAGLALAGLAVGGSAYLALAVASVAVVFGGVGALASQVAPTRRLATELATGMLALAFLLRVIADTSSSLDGLRWLTPLGWAEAMRPFTGARPAVLLLPLATSALLFAGAAAIAVRRDVGRGLLASDDSAPPRLALLASPTSLALRLERGSLIAWLVGTGVFAVVVGVLSKSVENAHISGSLLRHLSKLGVSITTATGYIGLAFIMFVFALSLFGCSRIAAARAEEAGEQLETLLALPVDRRRWLGGRLLLATAALVVLGLWVGLLTWAGATAAGADVPFGKLVATGLNALPTSLLFLGVGALAYALAPRHGAGIAYGVVSVAFVWELFGALLGAPAWTLDLSPFHHVGRLPAGSFEASAAAVMLAIGAAAGALSLVAFRRRDLAGV